MGTGGYSVPHCKRGQLGNLELPTEDGALPHAELLGAGRPGALSTSRKPACAWRRSHTEAPSPVSGPPARPTSQTATGSFCLPAPPVKLVEPSCGGDWGSPPPQPYTLSAACRLGNTEGKSGLLKIMVSVAPSPAPQTTPASLESGQPCSSPTWGTVCSCTLWVSLTSPGKMSPDGRESVLGNAFALSPCAWTFASYRPQVRAPPCWITTPETGPAPMSRWQWPGHPWERGALAWCAEGCS